MGAVLAGSRRTGPGRAAGGRQAGLEGLEGDEGARGGGTFWLGEARAGRDHSVLVLRDLGSRLRGTYAYLQYMVYWERWKRWIRTLVIRVAVCGRGRGRQLIEHVL